MKNLELMSMCFSKDAAGEFSIIVNQTATADQVNEFAEFFGGAEVGEAKLDGDRAYVKVKLTSRNENITVKKEGDDWKVVDF